MSTKASQEEVPRVDILAAIDLMMAGDVEAAEEVRNWVRQGGFVPDGWQRDVLLMVADAFVEGGAVVTLDEV